MIPIVRRYCVGRPASERLVVQQTWDKLWKRNANESDTRGLLPSFGKTALEFIKVMEQKGIRARKVPDAIAPRAAGAVYGTTT